MRNKRLCRNSRICLSFPVVYGSVWQVVGDQHPKIRRNVFDESKEVDYVYLLVIKYSIKILRDKHCLSYCLSYSAGDLGFSRRPLVQPVPGTLAKHKWIFAIQAYYLNII